MRLDNHAKVILAACISIAGLAGATVVDKPLVMPDAMGCVVVSDVHGFIDGAGSVAAQVSPMVNGMMIKSMLGMQLGDPGLMGIAPEKGLAVVIVDQTNIFAVIEVGEAQMAAYSSALAAKGMQSKIAEGVLVAAKTNDQLERGASLVAAVKENLFARRSPELQITFQPAAFIEKNDAQIQGMLQMMPMMMGMGMQQTPGMDMDAIQGMTRMLEAEVRILLSLASQCDTASVVLSPKDGSLVISETFVPRPGTRLASLINAPKISSANPKIQSGLLGEAAVAIDANMGNPDAVTDFLAAETEQVIMAMNSQDLDVSGIVSCLKKWMNIYNGSFSETVDFGDEGGFAVNYVMGVRDEAAALTLFRTIRDDLGPFIKLYEMMGMPMSVDFEENAREYKGVSIHRLKVTMSLEHLPEEQRSQMEEMNLSNMRYDVAILNGLLIYTMGEKKVETIIDRVMDEAFTPVPLKARGVYPAGAFYYCDIDIAKYISFVASVMPQTPDNPLPQIAAMLQGTEPVTSAGFNEDGAVMWSVTVPGALIGKIGQAAMMMQMQQAAASVPPATIPGELGEQMPAPAIDDADAALNRSSEQ